MLHFVVVRKNDVDAGVQTIAGIREQEQAVESGLEEDQRTLTGMFAYVSFTG
jgi:hypothetical protein